MDDPRRDIFAAVAAGTLTPEDAARLLGDADASAASGPDPHADTVGGGATGTAEDPGTPIRRLRISGAFGGLRVIADSSIQGATAEGPHRAHHDGDTLVITSDEESRFGDSFSFSGGEWPWVPWGVRGPGRRQATTQTTTQGWQTWPLRIRANPDLPLEAEIRAGSLRVTDMRGPIKVDVASGSAVLDGVGGPLDISTAAGSVKITGRLDHGESKVRCDAGAVSVHLQKGSSVRVRVRTALASRIVLPGSHATDELSWSGGLQETTVGDGAGLLEIESRMGSVRVQADQ